MYSAVLLFHSWLRWLALIVGVLVLARAVSGRNGAKPWTAADTRAMRLFIIVLDVQVLLGLALYVGISPITAIAFQNLAAAMRDPSLRFFVVEHAIGMLVAVALAHVGSVKIRKAADAAAKHRLALTFVALALLAMVLSIPWPGMPAGRPLFRF
jgi:hypothetical protein